MLALWATCQGVPVRIVDSSPAPGETSRALAIQSWALQLYRQLDLADDVVSAGQRTRLPCSMKTYGPARTEALNEDTRVPALR